MGLRRDLCGLTPVYQMDDMKIKVKCKFCNDTEYYGMMHWHDGTEMCRKCIYRIWEKESKGKWTPKEKDFIFPKYQDGNEY